ncbi:MAG: hypothetical protein PVG49_17485 [Desulfobacteraceae bacterium]|jgi:hypothetical protein
MAYEEEGFLGSGDLNIDVYGSDGNLTGELDVGNASAFAINAPSVEKKEQTGFRRENYGKTIGSTIVKIKQELKITLTDINRKNLALAMLGTDADYTQTAGDNTSSPETVTAHLDKWTKLSNRNLDPENAPTVKDSTETTTYVENTDYEVDYQVGRIKALSGGSISDEESLKVGSTWLAITGGFKVDGLELNKIEAFIRLIGKDQANNRDCEVLVYKAELTPGGDLNWLTDDYATLELTGEILDTADGAWDVIFY